MPSNRKPYWMSGVEEEEYLNLNQGKLRWSGAQYTRMMEEQIRFVKQKMLDKESQFERPYIPGTNYPRMNWMPQLRWKFPEDEDGPEAFPSGGEPRPTTFVIYRPGFPGCWFQMDIDGEVWFDAGVFV